MTAFEVDLVELEAVVAELAASSSALTARIAELDDAVADARQDWSGAAAEAATGAHRQLMTGAREVHAALVGLRAAARQAHRSYTAAETANAATWRHLG